MSTRSLSARSSVAAAARSAMRARHVGAAPCGFGSRSAAAAPHVGRAGTGAHLTLWREGGGRAPHAGAVRALVCGCATARDAWIRVQKPSRRSGRGEEEEALLGGPVQPHFLAALLKGVLQRPLTRQACPGACLARGKARAHPPSGIRRAPARRGDDDGSRRGACRGGQPCCAAGAPHLPAPVRRVTLRAALLLWRSRLRLLRRSDETAEDMLARTFVAPLHTGVAAIDRCAGSRRKRQLLDVLLGHSPLASLCACYTA
jgi:hypothetical protein